LATLPRTLSDNPIARAELTHQQRTVLDHKWRRWPVIFGVALVVALLSTASLLVAPQLADLLNISVEDVDEALRGWFSTVTVLMAALLTSHHLSFSSAALQVASTAIAREKQARTWEDLLLTGVDARRIVYGKWWATTRTLWQAYRPLLLLRFAVGVWMGVSSGIARISPFYYTPPLPNTLLIALATAVFPLCYSAFTVSVGLLASLLVRNETTAYRLASALQFAAVVVSLSLILVSFSLPITNYESGIASLIPALFVTPLDGGMLGLIGIIANDLLASLFYLVGLVLCLALYAALTWLVLRAAQSIAVRQRALPPRKD
jgi:hypothetical protein